METHFFLFELNKLYRLLNAQGKTIWDNSPLFQHDNAILYGKQRVITILQITTADNFYIIPYAAVFIYDSVLNIAAVANTQGGYALLLIALHIIERGKIIITH